ncbi:MAG: hypothetical protein JOZ90_09790 [Alphaproteobacteria bacterium]|nr:hypothetical protein [Alphaproteobacteria bacterium]MBV9373008.1 hypothetical protein [Alphaproteobacteria bacterium]MBV9901375.1 hypothetical protein [Alphaproteobacteria bacterium]
MSHIPNNAMPHAKPAEPEAPAAGQEGGGVAGSVIDALGGAVERVVEAAKANPKAAIAAGVAVAGAVAAAGVAAARGRGGKSSGGSGSGGSGAAKPAAKRSAAGAAGGAVRKPRKAKSEG